jgi:hypothetical protein
MKKLLSMCVLVSVGACGAIPKTCSVPNEQGCTTIPAIMIPIFKKEF